MEYVKPFTYFVGATGGFKNFLLCGVVNLIPVVGQIVLLGYRAEVADELVRDPELRRHPKFDFNRFGEYLTRGLWPFLYQIMVGVAAATVVLGGLALVGLAIASVKPKGDPTLVIMAVMVGYVVLLVGTTVLTAIFVWPMELHAQLSQRFAPVEAFGYATRFQRLMWGQTLTSVLMLLIGGVPIGVLGLLACYFGYLWAIVVMFMAQQHLITQLYRLYLDAGGDPIPTAEEEYDDFEDEDEEPRG